MATYMHRRLYLEGPVRALGTWAIRNIIGDELFAIPFRDSRRKDVREFMEFGTTIIASLKMRCVC